MGSYSAPQPMPIFIGFDSRETIAYHVLSHSIITRAKIATPLISPIGNEVLANACPALKRDEKESTEFSRARFLVPYLMGYQGWALYLDCDMLCMADIGEVWMQRDERYALQVVKHDHRPDEEKKFLGAKQLAYPRKNWSSMMLLNCAKLSVWSPDFVAGAGGLQLHQFEGIAPEEIGAITGRWNVLVLEDRFSHPTMTAGSGPAKLVHFTLGGPWHGKQAIWYGECWWQEANALLRGNNPHASAGRHLGTTYGP